MQIPLLGQGEKGFEMKQTDGSIMTIENDGSTTEETLFTYSEEERQENDINRANSRLVFQPAFIPFFVSVQREMFLTDTETKLFGFIWFYLSNNSSRFYFKNEQLAAILNCSPDTISRSISTLVSKGLIETSRKIMAGGGQIRFVTRLGKNYKSDLTISTSQTRQKLQTNNNKINNNKINNIIAHKEQSPQKTFKRLKKEEQQPIHKLVYLLEDVQNTRIVNWGKQAKALSMMKKAGYTENVIEKIIKYMATEDEFFSEKGFDLMTVANNIGRYRAEANKNGLHN